MVLIVLGGCAGDDTETVAVPDYAAPLEPNGGDPPPEDIVKDCGPTAGSPRWIEEGERLAVTVSCRSGAPVERHAFRMPRLPSGARFDEERGRFFWRPALDQAGVYWLEIITPATGERGHLKVGVADRFDDPANKPIRSPENYTEEMGLPVFHVRLPANVDAVSYTTATLIYGGRRWKAEGKLRGRTSLAYPKKSYTLKFPKSARFSDPLRAGGFVGKRRVALRSTFDDNSYLRERLAYEVWNRVDPAKLRVQTYSAVLYVNDQYAGIYTAADAIHEELFLGEGVEPGGSLYKALGHTADFFNGSDPEEKFEKKSGDEDDFSDLLELIEFILSADGDAFRAEAAVRLDLPNYGAWLITVSSMLAQDSLAKNTYHYRDVQTGQWRAIPWDFNASWGQAWDTRRVPADIDPIDQAWKANALFRRLLDDESFGPRIHEQYREALQTRVPLPTLLGLVEAAAAEVAPAVRRDERRWRAEHLRFERWADRTDFNDFAREVVYVQHWIRERWTYLAERLMKEP